MMQQPSKGKQSSRFQRKPIQIRGKKNQKKKSKQFSSKTTSNNNSNSSTPATFQCSKQADTFTEDTAVCPRVYINSDQTFDPPLLVIQPGMEVVWTNRADIARADIHSIACVKGLFESNELQHGESFRHLFTSVGIFDYYDKTWGHMKGVIKVVPILSEQDKKDLGRNLSRDSRSEVGHEENLVDHSGEKNRIRNWRNQLPQMVPHPAAKENTKARLTEQLNVWKSTKVMEVEEEAADRLQLKKSSAELQENINSIEQTISKTTEAEQEVESAENKESIEATFLKGLEAVEGSTLKSSSRVHEIKLGVPGNEYAFTPVHRGILVGDVVVWKNMHWPEHALTIRYDVGLHEDSTAKKTATLPIENTELSSPGFTKNETFACKFHSPGVVAVRCDTMDIKGTLRVYKNTADLEHANNPRASSVPNDDAESKRGQKKKPQSPRPRCKSLESSVVAPAAAMAPKAQASKAQSASVTRKSKKKKKKKKSKSVDFTEHADVNECEEVANLSSPKSSTDKETDFGGWLMSKLAQPPKQSSLPLTDPLPPLDTVANNDAPFEGFLESRWEIILLEEEKQRIQPKRV